MIPLAEAQQLVLQHCRALAPREFDASDLGGLVLATEIVAAESVPPFRNSAVDGYAVQADDTIDAPTRLDVIDEVAAGQASSSSVGPGQAIRIMTGAPVPDGADAVVMVEQTNASDDRQQVTVHAAVSVGAGIRDAGSDIAAGDRVFESGTYVTPAVAGVLASINVRRARAIPRPRVAVVSTGDELITDGSPLGPGQIRESNLTMLAGLVAQSGMEVVNLGVVADDEAELERVLRSAVNGCDAVISSGGVSMGDYDVVKAVLARIAEMNWMQVAIKPAKPFAFGILEGIPIFGLPGNPVSSLVSFEMLARPALRKIAGHTQLERPTVVAIADRAMPRRADGRIHLDRVIAHFADDGRVHVTPARSQGSHQLAATALANGLAAIPDGEGIGAGDEVTVLLLD